MPTQCKFLATLLIAFVAGCSSNIVDDPVVMVDADDAEMRAAEQVARDNLDEFIGALKNPAPGQESFAVKVKFVDGDDVEFMWLNELRIEKGNFVGVVNNDPQLVANVAIGDQRTVTPEEVTDWLFIDNGKMRGGYTVDVLMRRSGG